MTSHPWEKGSIFFCWHLESKCLTTRAGNVLKHVWRHLWTQSKSFFVKVQILGFFFTIQKKTIWRSLFNMTREEKILFHFSTFLLKKHSKEKNTTNNKSLILLLERKTSLCFAIFKENKKQINLAIKTWLATNIFKRNVFIFTVLSKLLNLKCFVLLLWSSIQNWGKLIHF